MLRIFCFECQSCSYRFELKIDSEQIVGYKTYCPQCKSNECYRDYFSEKVLGDTGPKTLGMLADLNSKKKKQ